MPQRDSLGYTFSVAAVLCVACSLAVSAAAVALRPAQEENKLLDRQRNILDAAGLALGEKGYLAGQLSKEEVANLYSRVEERLVNLETGEYETGLDIKTYEPRDAAKKEATSTEINDPKFNIGIDRREKVVRIYLIRDPKTKQISQVVLPVYGKGLWSTLYGYLAVKKDLQTVQGLTFYEHAETPGLGGEVDNPAWKAQWVGLKLYDEEGNPAAGVAKGPAPPDSEHLVDGLSGATITARGVANLIGYWTGPDGYGQYLKLLNEEMKTQQTGDSDGKSAS
jgi:Na+-transporting NADH:ubiquinone oxidoreductase subunit C